MSTFAHTDYNSSAYNAFRPNYGQNLYDKIFSFHKSHNGKFNTALDIATGTGQVSSELSNSFDKVYATDISSTMLQNAIQKSNIAYSISTAEDLSQFRSNSIDLITAAQAAHWFEMEKFYKESFRVLKPHGTLAIWGYSINVLKDYPIVRQLMRNLVTDEDKLGPYWDKGVDTISNLYKDFKFPEEMFQNIKWEIYKGDENSDVEPLLEVCWTIPQFTKYMKTWSAYKNYLKANPNSPDPVDNYIIDLKQLTGWKDHDVLLRISWESVLILAERKPVNRNHETNHLARRNLLQARAVVTVTVSALAALITQLFTELFISFKNTSEIINGYSFPSISTPVSLTGVLIFTAILYFIPSERITISQAARIGIYFFLSISAYISYLGNGFQALSHANFFAVPPFSYIFVSKNFGKQTTILVCIIYTTAFFRSIGGEVNPISLSSSGWVVCDVYIICLVAYEQEYQTNQERLQKSLDEAKSATTAKSLFISNVSHGILATVEILAKTKLNESQRALLNAIESCGTNLISVVNQVLTYARIEHGKMELEQSVFDIYSVLQEIGDGLAPIPERKNVDFFVGVKMSPLHRFLVGDVGVLRQIILNLLGNSIKFTDKGSIDLIIIEISDDEGIVPSQEVGNSKQLSSINSYSETINSFKQPTSESKQTDNTQDVPKVKFCIEVIDSGRGIAPEFINHMYQPFSQEDSSLRRKFEGTGLGLSIVKGLLDMMHSRLEVDSKLGQGSKFSFIFELPMSDRLDDLYASPLPFDHKYLKLSSSEQETLTKKLRSLSYVALNTTDFLFSQRITYYLDQWEVDYRLKSKDELKIECTESKHADLVILNDSISDLEWFLNEFTQYQQMPNHSNSKESAKENQVEVECIEDTGLLQQRVLFFATIGNYQETEKILKKYKPQSVIIVTKPAGPVKLLSAIIRAMESLLKKSEESSINEYYNVMKVQEEKERLIREEYINFIKDSNINKIGPMDIGELAISPSRLTPPVLAEGILFGMDKEIIYERKEQKKQLERTNKDKNKVRLEPVSEKNEDPKNISFLIVEDNKINEMILITMLKQSGYYNYDVANNGLEAVKMFSQKSYDIIFMDLQMPICDGIEATKERGEESYLAAPIPRSRDLTSESTEQHNIGSRRKKRRKKAIIVAMTGLASKEDSQIAEAAGCNEFLSKPVSIKSLNARMKIWTKEVLNVEEEENEDDKGEELSVEESEE
ncbi:268_t:CDS:10 [Funneliformis caledonium]|uniref:268_t:CDS:1 n=1 Tax=Funneliformis caledonium TaxID=1117310 RepID=A0A9N9B050_9GLOM|nr:268_t:CDS:10 [Funneliformis caledonium]